MESLLIAAGIVVPMALKMLLGCVIGRSGIIDRPTMRRVDGMCFKALLPTLLFYNIYSADLGQDLDWRVIAFAVAACFALFFLALWIVPRLEKEARRAASIGQAVVRSNFVIFGMTVASALYGEGNAGAVALLGAFAVPLVTAMAVVILERSRSGRASLRALTVSVLKNPIVIAALVAFLFRALPFRLPDMILRAVKDVAGIATTLSFISLGVSLELSSLRATGRSLLLGTALRMLVVPALFMPLAVLLGFRGQALCGLMVLFVSPAGVSTYPMAVAMDADGQLAGQLVVSTTLLSILTIFLATLLFSSLGWL